MATPRHIRALTSSIASHALKHIEPAHVNEETLGAYAEHLIGTGGTAHPIDTPEQLDALGEDHAHHPSNFFASYAKKNPDKAKKQAPPKRRSY
jgi:hypothetical protein